MDEVVDVICEDPRWEGAGLAALAVPAVGAVFDELGMDPQGFGLCVMGCDDARIAALNADFRGKPSPTNVLSWPSAERGAKIPGDLPARPTAGPPDDPEHLGDIALSFDTCMAEAQAAQKPFAHHVTHLVVHGVLHLLGYDHIRDADGDVMEASEARILARLGLPNPYIDA